MLAPHGVNHVAQNNGIEEVLRLLHESGSDPHVVVQTGTRRLAVPLAGGAIETVDIMSSIRYDVSAGAGHPAFFFDVQVRPDGSWSVTHNVPGHLVPPNTPLPTGGLR